MATTPTKSLPRCISCQECRQRYYLFSGKKMSESKSIIDIIRKNCNVKDGWMEDLSQRNASICRGCFNKLDHFNVFMQQFAANLDDSNEGNTISSKRQLAPDSPQLMDENIINTTPSSTEQISNKHVGMKRRKLFLSPNSEHGYALKNTSDENTVNPAPVMEQDRSSSMLKKMKDVRGKWSGKITEQLNIQLDEVHKSSVLTKCRSLDKLEENNRDIVLDILEECSEKVPLLFEIIVQTMGKITSSCFGPISAIYSILQFQRNHMLSAFQRCMSAICLRGQLEDSALVKLSHFGLTLSTSSKLRIQDEACQASRKIIVENLKKNPLIKVTGDNLDVYIKRDILSTTTRNKDLHLFASNIIFTRIANVSMENVPPQNPTVNVLSFDMTDQQRFHLKNLYKSILADIFAKNINGYEWINEVKFAPHEFTDYMAQKSLTAQLPIMECNEAKHEDCLKIMDGYIKQLTELYTEAFGSDEKLKEFKVVVGGDQLTRSRLSEAKALRSLSANPKKRFDDIDAIVIELWHIKQDLLEKCFKALFNTKTLRTEGSLSFFKARLQRTDVCGKVKGHFKAHMQFLELIGEMVIAEQGRCFLEEFSDEDLQYENVENQTKIVNEILDQFLDQFNYLPEVNSVPLLPSVKDETFNYFNNLAQWYMHIESMNKVAKEGDITRIIPNMLMSLPLFYHHSTLSKYLVECMNYITAVEHFLSPLMKLRVLEGSFVNVKGGKGNNVESDLLQEHSVRNQKCLIKQLGANKSSKAIERASGAAGAISAINFNIEKSLGIKPKSSKHSKVVSEQDRKIVSDVLVKVNPFTFTAGRKFEGFGKLGDSVFACIDGTKMRLDFDVILKRLLRGFFPPNDDEDIDSSDSEIDSDDFPDI